MQNSKNNLNLKLETNNKSSGQTPLKDLKLEFQVVSKK